MKIKISAYRIKKAREFARLRMKNSSSLYKYRGETNVDKMFEDIVVGVLGEWGAYEFLLLNGIQSSKPDLNLYEAKKKSFSADLRCSRNAYHVKSQSAESAKKYGHSWLLQVTDRIVKNPAGNDYFILTCVTGNEVEILGLFKCSDIKYGECRVPRYRHSKVALYLNDVKLSRLDIKEVFSESKSM